MRPPTLQYFYLQRPLILLLFIATVSVLLWIGAGDFYTKGEPREASVAVSMIEDGNWILPQVYADEFAYKPPFTHWLMAIFSLPKGEVSPFTARLPSALAFIIMIGVCFVFFGEHLKFQKAFLACLIMITSFELHRAAMTARVDMVLTFLIVAGLISLYLWEDKRQLKGIPIASVLLLSCAVLVKGPVGIILPLLVFEIYLLLLKKYKFWNIVIKAVIVALLSMILPAIWYYLAYKTAGQEFLDLVWAENFGRFLGSENLDIKYDLGHKETFLYNFLTLIAGFVPWTILLFFSLFGIKYSFKFAGFKSIWEKICSLSKVKLFSLVASVIIIAFYCIPSSKRSVYLMPAYPFISIFIAQFVLYLTEYKTRITRIFSYTIAVIGSLVFIICLLTIATHVVDPAALLGSFVKDEKAITDIGLIWNSFQTPRITYMVLFGVLLFALYVLFLQLGRKNNLKILYATIGTYLAINLVLDGVVLPAYKNGISTKPLAQEIEEVYLDGNKNIYVVNNLLEYSNMYGLNFYLHNNFHNFEKEMPEKGLLLIGKDDFTKLSAKYADQYEFDLLKEAQNRCRDGQKIVQLYEVYKLDH